MLLTKATDVNPWLERESVCNVYLTTTATWRHTAS